MVSNESSVTVTLVALAKDVQYIGDGRVSVPLRVEIVPIKDRPDNKN